MRSVTLLLMMLSACGSLPSIDPHTYPYEALPAPGPRLALQSAAPEPGFGWLSDWILTEGFPAISTDRELVVVARAFQDGERANPNLTLEAYRVSDGVRVLAVPLVTPDDPWVTDEPTTPMDRVLVAQVHARFAEARAFLRKKQWTPLEPLLEAAWADSRDVFYHFTSDGGVALRWSEPELLVDIAIDPLTYIKDESTWSVPPSCNFPQCDCELPESARPSACACDHPGRISTAWIAGDVVFAEVTYEGNEFCWEPEDRFVFERLPTSSAKGWRRQPRDAAELAKVRFVWESLDIPTHSLSSADRVRARLFLLWWERRAPDSPEVKAARTLLGE